MPPKGKTPQRGVRVRPSSTPSRKKSQTQVVSTTTKQKSPPAHQLDANALSWVKLLKDPCNADLNRPCYPGTSSGYLTRTRNFYPIPPTATDGVFEFTPCYTGSDNGMLRYSWANTAGGNLGAASSLVAPPFLTSQTVGKYRCVAACMKLHYTGTELNRSGIGAVNIYAGGILTHGETIGTNAPGFFPNCAYVGRIRDGPMEVKWVPNHADGNWVTNTSSDELKDASPTPQGNSLFVAYSGVPQGSLQLELVAVWEWQPTQETMSGPGAGLTVTSTSPASRNHLNEILSALGDIGKFAVGKIATYGPYALEQAVKFL